MIELKDINKGYGDQQVLKGLSLHVNDGEMIAVTGPSGSGKSTLLNILGGIDKPDSGIYMFDDQNITDISYSKLHEFIKKNINFIFQDFQLLEKDSVYDNVAVPLIARKEKNKKEKILKALEFVNMKENSKKKVNVLSGGEKQRVAIARAMVTGTGLILADEPTGSLDEKNTADIIKIFDDIHKSGRTIVFVTHDTRLLDRFDKVYEFDEGKLKTKQ